MHINPLRFITKYINNTILQLLLNHNFLSIVRLAACFDQNQARANISQHKEFGQDKIQIRQIFWGQWAADQKHIDLYCQTVKSMGKLPLFDVQTCLLLQLVALFDTFGLENLENVRLIENQQIIFVEMILSYLRTKVGAGQSNTVLQKYLNYLPKLRILCEMITKATIWINKYRLIFRFPWDDTRWE